MNQFRKYIIKYLCSAYKKNKKRRKKFNDQELDENKMFNNEKSSQTIWTVFLVIKELSIEERYYWENVLIAGKFNFN